MSISAKFVSDFCGTVDSVISPYFRGVYSINVLDDIEPNLDLNSKNCIVIHSEHHFVGIYFETQENRSAFIDSVKNTADSYTQDLQAFVDYYAPHYNTVPFRVQGSSSNYCAAYVIYYFHQLCDNMSISEASVLFSAGKFRENDREVISWFKQHFSKTSITGLFK